MTKVTSFRAYKAMKRLFDEEISMDELRKLLKKFKKRESCNAIALLIMGLLFAAAVTVLVLMKVHNCGLFAKGDDCCCDCDEDCDEDCECDENGCSYTTEDDFAE